MSEEKSQTFLAADDLLKRARAGDTDAMNELWQLMWPEFRSVARALLQNETHRTRYGTTGSGLVAELWMHLTPNLESVTTARGFLEYGRKAMRNILVDYARRRKAKKRDWGTSVELDSPLVQKVEARLAKVGLSTSHALESVLEVIDSLKDEDPALSEIVELFYIYGHSQEESAAIMDMSRQTFQRRLAQAVAILKEKLGL
jgi:RNA polymerase sigma factor (TIGR02999 family)